MNTTFQPETPNGIRLGYLVRDKITGYEGVVVRLAHFSRGNWEVQVQAPRFHEGVPVEPVWFDAIRVEHVYEEPVLNCPPVNTPAFNFGEVVVNTYTHQQGCIRCIFYSPYAFVRYGILSPQVEENGDTIVISADENLLVSLL